MVEFYTKILRSMMWFIEEGDVEIGGGFLDIEFIFEMEVVLYILFLFVSS